jgi:hypothetical protein
MARNGIRISCYTCLRLCRCHGVPVMIFLYSYHPGSGFQVIVQETMGDFQRVKGRIKQNGMEEDKFKFLYEPYGSLGRGRKYQ